MKPRERKVAPLGFLSAGSLFFVADLLPGLKGRPFNPAFIGVGVIFLLGLVMLRKSSEPEPPSS